MSTSNTAASVEKSTQIRDQMFKLHENAEYLTEAFAQFHKQVDPIVRQILPTQAGKIETTPPEPLCMFAAELRDINAELYALRVKINEVREHVEL